MKNQLTRRCYGKFVRWRSQVLAERGVSQQLKWENEEKKIY
jgi:hypothetical protein